MVTITTNLGSNIKTIRKARKMSLKDLSSKVGVSISFLSQIENGKNIPSLTTLKKISDALDVTLSRLLGEDNNNDEQYKLVRVNERHRLTNIGENNLEIEFLSAFNSNNIMEVCIHSLCATNNKKEPQPYSHNGQEVFYVVSGTFKMIVDGNSFIMNEGDCYYLNDCSKNHVFINISKDKIAKMMCVTTPPYFYAHPKTTTTSITGGCDEQNS
ncbi:MAG: helix-turn-helix domain-containing protein [Christensenellales bacterium]|jgi:transcriptional regulator with XRE-family HTH domain